MFWCSSHSSAVLSLGSLSFCYQILLIFPKIKWFTNVLSVVFRSIHSIWQGFSFTVLFDCYLLHMFYNKCHLNNNCTLKCHYYILCQTYCFSLDPLKKLNQTCISVLYAKATNVFVPQIPIYCLSLTHSGWNLEWTQAHLPAKLNCLFWFHVLSKHTFVG